ncbi:hypothetical protein HPB50_000251 [Hyalomma asiaticum]|uniref:Uncharacterized protein n=1 Tax=Hyalomma asiaticum TaxID=266040 RepID=A0ACB7T546_HYAAI|nr:hypothetical protein HPB50_000251 [Hyalomma asiaticum]
MQSETLEKKFTSELVAIHRKLTELLDIKAEVDALSQIKTTVDSIEESMKFMSSKYDEVLVQMTQQSADISDLRRRVVKLEA